MRAAFRALCDFDVVVLTDGDGTYPAESAMLLVGPLLVDAADMAVGARRPVPGTGAMSPVRGFGNLLIRAAFRILIGRGTADLLSGYRTFNRRFREAVRLRSTGFEIETELASEAVAPPAPCRRDRHFLSQQDCRYREQAACVSRRATNPAHDLVSEPAASTLSTGAGMACALCCARSLCESRICGGSWFWPPGAVGALPF